MFRRLLAAAMLMLAVCASAPAWAADPVQSSLPLTASGQTYNECIYSDGTRFYVCHLLYGWTGSAAKPWSMDTNGYGGVNVQNWPSTQAVTISGTPTFNLTGTLPGFATTPTFNIGTGGPSGYTLEGGHIATVDASTAALATTAGSKADAASIATDTTPASMIAALKGQIVELKAIVTALGANLNVTCSGCSSSSAVSLNAGSNTIGAISNTSFALTGSLPGFASAPTFNLGTLNGAATSAKQDSLLAALGTPFQAGGTVNIGTGGPVGYSLDATLQATNTDLGAPGSTTCATDTGSCALNALLQRNNQRLSALLTAVGSPLQAGGTVTTADYRPASSTITAADAGTTTIAGQNSVTLVTGTPTANSFLTWALNGYSSATITVPSVFTGSAQLEVSADGGTTYAPASGKITGAGATTAAITAPGVFRVDVTGMTNIRLRATALSAGPITAQLAASAAPGLAQIINPVRLADSTGTSYGATNPIYVAPGTGIKFGVQAAIGDFATCALFDIGCGASPAANTVNYNLAQLHTDHGVSGTGITPPTGGSGVLGWLSGSYLGLGAPGATACATDTGSCSINAQMQRLAVDITAVKTAIQALTQSGATQAVSLTTLPGYTSTPAFKMVDSGGGDATDPTNHAVKTSLSAISTGGFTPYHFISTASTNATLVSTGAHTLGNLTLTGLNTTVAYVRLYDSASAPTCSSSTGAIHTYAVIGSATALGGLVVPIPPQGEAYTNGLAFCITGGSADTDNTSAVAGVLVNLDYK